MDSSQTLTRDNWVSQRFGLQHEKVRSIWKAVPSRNTTKEGSEEAYVETEGGSGVSSSPAEFVCLNSGSATSRCNKREEITPTTRFVYSSGLMPGSQRRSSGPEPDYRCSSSESFPIPGGCSRPANMGGRYQKSYRWSLVGTDDHWPSKGVSGADSRYDLEALRSRGSRDFSIHEDPLEKYSKGTERILPGVHVEQPSCPICMELLDDTDSSFSSCCCGFKLCLFCHHTIATKDGRCPGCRKSYDPKYTKRSNSKARKTKRAHRQQAPSTDSTFQGISKSSSTVSRF